MKLGKGIAHQYTFTVEQEREPAVGDRYMCPLGHTWWVEQVYPYSITLFTEYRPTHPVWAVTLRGDSIFHRLDQTSTLRPLREGGCGGHLERRGDDVVGFGNVTVDGEPFSWIFLGLSGGTYRFHVGDPVNNYNAFARSRFFRDGTFDPHSSDFPWSVVTDGLAAFEAVYTDASAPMSETPAQGSSERTSMTS